MDAKDKMRHRLRAEANNAWKYAEPFANSLEAAEAKLVEYEALLAKAGKAFDEGAAVIEDLRTQLAEAEAGTFRVTREWAEDSAQLHKRLAEAERLLRATVHRYPMGATNDAGVFINGTLTGEILTYFACIDRPLPADSAPAVLDLMQHCCPSCGQPSGKGIDMFTYMADLVTKHPTAKGMLDLAMARATAGSASAVCICPSGAEWADLNQAHLPHCPRATLTVDGGASG